MHKLFISYFFFIFCNHSKAQDFEIIVKSSMDSLAVEKANVFADGRFAGETDKDGHLKISTDFRSLKITHISFNDAEFSFEGNQNNPVIYLKEKEHLLEVVEIERKEPEFHRSATNFGWNDRAATLIPYKNGSTITHLKFRVRDFSGVKGLKYLPFKANIYSVGSDGKPGEPLIAEDVLVENREGKNWAKVDVSKYNLKVSEKGIYVVFIVPEKSFYKLDFIQARVGVISAVPIVKTRFFKDKTIRSYRWEYSKACKCYDWIHETNKYFMIDLELKEH